MNFLEELKNNFNSTLDFLEKINLQSSNKLIKKEEFLEQLENIVDFTNLIKALNILLDKMKNNDEKDKAIILKQLMYLHLNFSDLVWHTDEITELIKKLVTELKKYHEK